MCVCVCVCLCVCVYDISTYAQEQSWQRCQLTVQGQDKTINWLYFNKADQFLLMSIVLQ